MHVIIDLNCLSSCLSCLIKDSLGSVLFSEVQWSKYTPRKDVPQWEITTIIHRLSTAYPPDKCKKYKNKFTQYSIICHIIFTLFCTTTDRETRRTPQRYN